MNIIKEFENNTNIYYCIYEDINTVIGKNNIIIYDDRKKIIGYDDLYHEQKYNYLHVNKIGNITIKDIILKMSKYYFYIDSFINNEYIFLEGFDKVSEVQYNIQFGKWKDL